MVVILSAYLLRFWSCIRAGNVCGWLELVSERAGSLENSTSSLTKSVAIILKEERGAFFYDVGDTYIKLWTT